MKHLILILLLAMAGCQTTSSRLTAQEEGQIVALARSAVVASGALSAAEVRVISLVQPVLTYYLLARPYADYRVRWKLGGAEEIVVSGRGDILHLEKAVVKRRLVQLPQTTSGSSAPIRV